MTHEQKIAKAENNVKSLDQYDGFKDRYLGTILAALEAGLNRPETNAHYDALVMLRDLVETNRKNGVRV